MIGIDDILLTVAPDAIKGVAKAIPNAINKARFKNFFGHESISGENVYVVLDPYEHPVPRSQLQLGQVRFVKKFHGRKPNISIIGEDKLLGSCSVRVTKYSSECFSQLRSKDNRLKVVLDEEVMNLWDGTFFCFGSSDSNIKTFDIESLPQNNLYTFDFDQATGYRCFVVNGQRFSIANQRDKAILARLINPHYPEHNLFVCAGLGEWGTSGATYFLFDRWKALNKRFQRGKNFCLIIEVNVGSDESAREVLSYSP
jgi:hypothetical protein